MTYPNDDELEPEPNWRELPYLRVAARSFVRDGKGWVRSAFFFDEATGRFVGKVRLEDDAEGPPRHAHGGSQAAILDEMMGTAAWIAGHPCVAAEFTVKFRKSLPLGQVVVAAAWVERAEGRKVFTCAELRDESGSVYSESTGVFVTIGRDRFEALGLPTSD